MERADRFDLQRGDFFQQSLHPVSYTHLGDAFASGLIYAMLHDYKAMDMINFAVASSAINHTIHGRCV